MNGNSYSYKINNTSLHEAAHAVMCIFRGVQVLEVSVFEEPDQEGRFGECVHHSTDNYLDRVWIALAGPVFDALYQKVTVLEAFMLGGFYDFEHAFEQYGKFLYPKVPAELVEHIGNDAKAHLESVYAECGVDHLRGQMKRKLTIFTRHCMEAEDFIKGQVYEEAARVKDFILTQPGVFEAIELLADRLAVVREMSGREVIEYLRHHFQADEKEKLA